MTPKPRLEPRLNSPLRQFAGTRRPCLRPPRQRLLLGKLRCEGDRLELADTRRRWKVDIDPKRTVSEARRLSCCPHPDLDSHAYCQSVSLDGSQRRARPHAAFQTAHGTLRRPHSCGDFVLRHARGSARSYQIGHEALQRAVARERWRVPRGARPCQQRDAFGENLEALVHGPIRGSVSQVVRKNANSIAQTWPSSVWTNLRQNSAVCADSYTASAVRIFANRVQNALPGHVEAKLGNGERCVRSNRGLGTRDRRSADFVLPQGRTPALIVLRGTVMVNDSQVARDAQMVLFDRAGFHDSFSRHGRQHRRRRYGRLTHMSGWRILRTRSEWNTAVSRFSATPFLFSPISQGAFPCQPASRRRNAKSPTATN